MITKEKLLWSFNPWEVATNYGDFGKAGSYDDIFGKVLCLISPDHLKK